MRLPVGVSGEGAPVGVSGVIGTGACGRDGAEDPGAAFDEDASTRKREGEPPTRHEQTRRTSSGIVGPLRARALDDLFHRDARPSSFVPATASRPRYTKPSVP